MSKVKIVGNASGSGTLTITGPDTSSDRTITLPDATGTLLTEVADDAITLAKMASGTDGNIISYDASGDPVAIATGDDGQVLTSTGAGSPPAFEDAAGGGKILQVITDQGSVRETTTAVTFQTYDDISVTITPATTSSRILLLMSIGKVLSASRIVMDFQRAISGGATTTGITGEGGGLGYWQGDGLQLDPHQIRQPVTLTTVDSPSTTSAITYKMCYHTNDFQEAFIGESNTETSITAIEIGA